MEKQLQVWAQQNDCAIVVIGNLALCCTDSCADPDNFVSWGRNWKVLMFWVLFKSST